MLHRLVVLVSRLWQTFYCGSRAKGIYENERSKLFCNTAHSSIHLALVDRLVDLSGLFDVSSEGDDSPVGVFDG